MKSSQKLTKEQTDPYFAEWNRLSAELMELHSLRDKRSKELTRAGTELYAQLLAHCREALQDKGFEPLNGSERLAFVAASPATYAAFRQLDELFTELKKTVARKRIELNNSKE